MNASKSYFISILNIWTLHVWHFVVNSRRKSYWASIVAPSARLYVCVAFCCATKLAHTHKYREVHAHPPIHTRVYIYFNLMPWAIYYCADIIQTQWQWQWRGASSVLQFPPCYSLSLNAERRTSKRKWKMENVALCAYLWLLFFGGALSRRLSTPHWAGDDCRLQVATSVWGGVELGHSRTGILFRTRDSRKGGKLGLGQLLFAFDGDSTKWL